ncbi:hypothetical protein GGS23DRAFT_142228 [Durotheca rogersii]|uniref:uncharacterized protein n=1 Tax=Durotheca rogersii TaxID=419775 RepID=UPI00221F920D|nr:uncharacterized protein GGS23DRAFT_142228 [Durotheca rogersii]KAI5861621.1 hypothetical protein GGS23DRAFT_142228 [Durotheca rogersii]
MFTSPVPEAPAREQPQRGTEKGTNDGPSQSELRQSAAAIAGSATSQNRFPNGTTNASIYHPPNPRRTTETQREGIVAAKWPGVILPSDAANFPKCSSKNRVTIPPHLRLVRADHKTLGKLDEIQCRLRNALIPYELWAARVATELAGDFQPVANCVRNRTPSWVTFVGAIIHVLEKHEAPDKPLTTFAALLPIQGETLLNFVRRLREAFYRLPPRDLEAEIVRELLQEGLRTYTPSVWLFLRRDNQWNAAQIVEEAVCVAQTIERQAIERMIFSTPAVVTQSQGAAAPFYHLETSQATPSKPGTSQVRQPSARGAVPVKLSAAKEEDEDEDEDEGYAIYDTDDDEPTRSSKQSWTYY